jgi:hypothetical protein
MKLPIPQEIKNVLYTDFEVLSPTPDIVADTKKIMDQGNLFQSMRPFINGCLSSLISEEGTAITDSVSLRSIVPKLYHKNIEYICIQALLQHNDDDDGIEGIYYCPMCGTESKAEYKKIEDIIIDTRDKISNLKVGYFDPYKDNPIIHIELSVPVEIKDRITNEAIVDDIVSIDVEIPTFENCINAESKAGKNDSIRLQLAIYVEALKKVNGNDIDSRFKNNFGAIMFGRMRGFRKDLGKLSDEINRYGIEKEVEKTCGHCGKVWRPAVNTSNFFGSALRSF